MNYKRKESSGFFEETLRPALLGGLFSVAIIILIICLMALLMSLGVIPLKLSPLVASISTAIGGFFGGIFAAKKSRKNGFLVGALTGICVFILFSIFSLIVYKEAPSSATFIRAIIFLTSGLLGGVIGVGSDDKRKII